MAALAEVIQHPAVRDESEDPKEIVAVVFADGTVRPLRSPIAEESSGPMSSGTVSGGDWVLWWERRSF
jgi:hypothetical protein